MANVNENEKHEEEQNDRLRVVDKRRFRLSEDGQVEGQPDVIARVEQERAKQPQPSTQQLPQSTAPQAQQQPAQTPPQEGERAPKPKPPAEGMPLMDFVRQQAYLAMIYLGQQPNPGTGLVQPQPEGVREIIDVLLMLRSRTHGNLSQEEFLAISDLVRQLQMAYLQMTGGVPQGPAPL